VNDVPSAARGHVFNEAQVQAIVRVDKLLQVAENPWFVILFIELHFRKEKTKGKTDHDFSSVQKSSSVQKIGEKEEIHFEYIATNINRTEKE